MKTFKKNDVKEVKEVKTSKFEALDKSEMNQIKGGAKNDNLAYAA